MRLEETRLLSWDELLEALGWFCPLVVTGLGTPHELNGFQHQEDTHY